MTQLPSAHPGPAELVAWANGQALDEVAGHVEACPRCQRAARDWRIVGVRVGEALREEAEEAFTPERLAHQRASIVGRLRRGGRARVLTFPAPPAAVAQRPRLFRADVRRGVAAAALVGLVVGTLAGRFLLDPRPRQAARAAAGSDVARPVGAPATPLLSAGPVSDEAFLVELDAAALSSSPRALRAIDALTPDVER